MSRSIVGSRMCVWNGRLYRYTQLTFIYIIVVMCIAVFVAGVLFIRQEWNDIGTKKKKKKSIYMREGY